MSQWSSTNKPTLNTLVIVNPQFNTNYAGQVFTVAGHRTKNVLLKPAGNTVGRGLIINPAYLLPAPPKGQAAVVETLPVYPPLSRGTIVRVAGSGWKESANQLFVVHTDNTHKNNTVCLDYLGGSDTYYPKVPRGYITVVPLADVLK